MPFLTDKMQATKRKNLQKNALAADNVMMGGISQPHKSLNGISTRFKFDIDFIESELRTNIVGQDHIIDLVLNTLQVVRADICDPRKPLATVLFAGPTGVGKTEIVRTITRALYGDADRMCRVDMNTLAQEHYSAALTGAPPGYVGSKEGTTILDQEMIEGSNTMPGIVLFDELEKASNEVSMALLNVFDNGILTVASGQKTYSFRNAIIFMTSNLGAKELINTQERFSKLSNLFEFGSEQLKSKKIVEKKLLARFPPEFVNRIDDISVFNWLDRSVMHDLVAVEIKRLNNRLLKHDIRINTDDGLIKLLAKEGYSRRYGARALRRTVRQYVEFPLALFLNSMDIPVSSDIGQLNLNAIVVKGIVNFEIKVRE
jgi:ATP-dependent Clp protease ATP-binding subunit ClpA